MDVTFEPYTIGMGFTGNKVNEVDPASQAENGGVCVGMVITHVNGIAVPADTEVIIQEIKKTSGNNENTVITFEKDLDKLYPIGSRYELMNIPTHWQNMSNGELGEIINHQEDGKVKIKLLSSQTSYSLDTQYLSRVNSGSGSSNSYDDKQSGGIGLDNLGSSSTSEPIGSEEVFPKHEVPACTPKLLLIILGIYIVGVSVTLIVEGILVAASGLSFTALWYLVGFSVILMVSMCGCTLWLVSGPKYGATSINIRGGTSLETRKVLFCSAIFGILFGVGFGLGAGTILQEANYYEALSFNPNGDPSQNAIAADSSTAIEFMPGTIVDVNAASYQIIWDDKQGVPIGSPQVVICVAPIVLKNETHPVHYWAVSEGCCRGYPLDEIDYTDCHWTGDGKYGVDLLVPHQKLSLAVDTIASRNGIEKAEEPIYVEWVRDFDEIVTPKKEFANKLIFPNAFLWPVLFIIILYLRECCHK